MIQQPAGTPRGPYVVFPDKNLEAAVRQALERPKGPLTRGHLKRMKELEVNHKAIEDLTGLEHAVNLTKLNLMDNQISDVSPLVSLTNLGYLVLENNQLNQESIDVHVPNLRDRGVQVIGIKVSR